MRLRILTKEQRRAFRDDIREARAAGDEEEVQGLRDDRLELRRRLRAERRARGEAPDQVLAQGFSNIWNEEAANDFVDEVLADLAIDIIEGEVDMAEAVDEALAELAEDADELLDFSGVPAVGGILEMIDGPLFNLFIRDSLRPWVEQELRKLL